MKKINRLLKNEDFTKTIKARKRFSNKSMTLYYSYNNLNHLRAGVSVSKKLGIAIVRNKIKRQIRMMISENIPISSNLDIVIVANKDYVLCSYEENYKNFLLLIKNIKKEDSNEKEN